MAQDFRAKSTGSLKNGTRDDTYTNDLDIIGQSRDTTTPYIGAWEIPGSGGVSASVDTGAGISDALSVSLIAAVEHAQATGASDEAVVQFIAQAAHAEAAGASDAFVATLTLLASHAEALGVSDAVAAQLVALASAVESAGISFDTTAALVAFLSQGEAAGGDFVATALYGRYGHPIADLSNTGWTSTGASLYGVLNEAARDDAGYIEATNAAVARFDMTQHADPGATLHAIKIASPAGYVPQGTLTVRLYSADTLIATWVISDLAADEERQLDLTAGEAAAITDYTDLEIEVEASA